MMRQREAQELGVVGDVVPRIQADQASWRDPRGRSAGSSPAR